MMYFIYTVHLTNIILNSRLPSDIITNIYVLISCDKGSSNIMSYKQSSNIRYDNIYYARLGKC